MWGKAGSDMLSKFQLTSVTGIEFTEAVSVTGMNLARRLHYILIENNEYWLSLWQVSLHPAAVAGGGAGAIGYTAGGPALLLYWPRGAALPQGSDQAWCESGAFCAGAPWGLGWEMGTLGPSLWLRRGVSVKGWVLLSVLEMGGLTFELSV